MEFGNIHTDQRDGVSGPGINHHIRADIGGVIGQQISEINDVGHTRQINRVIGSDPGREIGDGVITMPISEDKHVIAKATGQEVVAGEHCLSCQRWDGA